MGAGRGRTAPIDPGAESRQIAGIFLAAGGEGWAAKWQLLAGNGDKWRYRGNRKIIKNHEII
jgi:hypothetical protein